MNQFKRRARWLFFLMAGLCLSLIVNYGSSPLVRAQVTPGAPTSIQNTATGAFGSGVTLTVENTAVASFVRPTGPIDPTDPNNPTDPTDPTPPTGPVETVTSNPTQVAATIQTSALEIIKTGDRAAAEPGDVITYRLLARNTGTVAIDGVFLEDVLPLGFQYVENSAQAATTMGSVSTPVAIANPSRSGRTLQFATSQSLTPGQTLTLVYAVLLTPDSIRGSGRNAATAFGTVGGRLIASNIASHQIVARPGILSDCGTIVGRVFVDKNFDGQQQPGEPGVPNAVIFMDDGNRILTDPDGLFSLANVIAGNRSGTLDLTSLPGYTLAPNLYWIEGNSAARLVRLQPGGLARMNFAVTPTYGEGQQ